MNPTKPFFSIVIPTYNRASFLEVNIPLLLNLKYEFYELIVVDDGSTDNTEALLNSIKDTKLHYYKKLNAERAAARNYGAVRAKGNYITFLDSDDILFNDALEKAANVIQEYNEPNFLHLGYEIGSSTKVNKTINGIKDNDVTIFIQGNPLSCMGVFLKKEIFQKHLFNEDRELSASEDWEFWIRLAAHYGIRTNDHIIGRLIEHDSRSVIKANEEKLVQRKNLAMKYAFEDEAVKRVFGTYKKSIASYWDTYISLHLAIDGLKSRASHHLINGLKNDFRCLFTKRGIVILKLLLLS